MAIDSELLEALEALVDSHTLLTVVGHLAQMCYEKAEHVRTNWQDDPLGKKWEAIGRKLENLEPTIERFGI